MATFKNLKLVTISKGSHSPARLLYFYQSTRETLIMPGNNYSPKKLRYGDFCPEIFLGTVGSFLGGELGTEKEMYLIL